MKHLFSLLVILAWLISPVTAQVYSNKVVGKKNADAIDSLKKSEYPFILPIWGAKATKAGFNLPYSAGISLNYLWQRSDLVIDNLKVGFNNGTQHNLNQIVRFDDAISEASGLNFRPDLWLFPFLNIYGIFAVSKPSTSVNFGVWVPDSTDTWKEVLNLGSKAEFNAYSVGFGLTPTLGVAGGWIALDMNFTWTDVDALDEPAFVFVFDPRIGKSFKFKKPERNIAVWVGGFRLKLNRETNGNLKISDLFSIADAETKIDQASQKVGASQQQVDAWWAGLTPAQQANPVNKAKYETANEALQKAGQFLNSASAAVSDFGNGTVQYSLDKNPKDKWNFLIGSQFQINKHWMVRGEYGFLASRQQTILGLQYRFGL